MLVSIFYHLWTFGFAKIEGTKCDLRFVNKDDWPDPEKLQMKGVHARQAADSREIHRSNRQQTDLCSEMMMMYLFHSD